MILPQQNDLEIVYSDKVHAPRVKAHAVAAPPSLPPPRTSKRPMLYHRLSINSKEVELIRRANSRRPLHETDAACFPLT